MDTTTTKSPAQLSPPSEGQLFVDRANGIWKVRRVTFADSPVGFFIVHLNFGTDLSRMGESMVLGPREFAVLVRDRGLQTV
jgi:hypothetical protein